MSVNNSGYKGWMVGWLMNNELERMCKEAVMTYFKVISWHSPRGTDENHEKPVKSSIPAKIQTKHLQNRNQKHYCLSEPAQYLYIIF
jgi:hypothetical protein